MKRQLTRLPAERVHEVWQILQLVADEIRAQGRRQRISQTSLETFQRWQEEDAAYIVTEDARIVGMVTLCREVLTAWEDVVGTASVPVIRGLAVHPQHQRRDIGSFALRGVLAMIQPDENVYLDCVSEFLPDYYAAHGFEAVARRRHLDDDGEEWDITLMRRRGVGPAAVENQA